MLSPAFRTRYAATARTQFARHLCRESPASRLRSEPEPAAHCRLHHGELFRIQLAQLAHELRVRNRDQVLRVKGAVAQESHANGHFISRTMDCGGVENEGDECAVVVAGRLAEDQSRPNLGG